MFPSVGTTGAVYNVRVTMYRAKCAIFFMTHIAFSDNSVGIGNCISLQVCLLNVCIKRNT